MMEELFQISFLDYLLGGGFALLFVLQVWFYGRYMAAPSRKLWRDKRAAKKAEQEGQVPEPKIVEGVTVVVCARNEACNLEPYIQSLLTQDWPEYEVIIVNDGSEDSTQSVIDSYLTADPRVRTTFVPRDAHVRSTKKLALTLAAKAAKYDILLLTDADCRPESKSWIRSMMEGFEKEGTDIVLGFGAYFDAPGELNRLIRYDTLFNGLHYLGAAIQGHPYMGVGRNLAYRKSLFFESGGFCKMMTQRAGDDDLFVNHVATGRNTAVVLKPESITWSLPEVHWRDWWQQKQRHLGVSPKYRFATRVRLLLEPLTRGAFYALFLVLMCKASLLIQAAAVLLFLVRLMMIRGILDTAAHRMGLKQVGGVLLLDIILPLISLWMLLLQPFRKQQRW